MVRRRYIDPATTVHRWSEHGSPIFRPRYGCRRPRYGCRPRAPLGATSTHGGGAAETFTAVHGSSVGCGDGACNAGESCSTCPDDCSPCPPWCGNGTCGPNESCSNCPGDCSPCQPYCGDGTCNASESCSNCPGDCGPCPLPGSCLADATTACLGGQRFEVRVTHGAGSLGRVASFGASASATFSFFAPENLEVVVNVLDGCGLNNRSWVYAAAATDLAFTITVTDTVTGDARTYANPAGTLPDAITDTNALATCGAAPHPPVNGSWGAPASRPSGAGCAQTATTACLSGGRFAVHIDYADSRGTRAASLSPHGTAQTGVWAFQSPAVCEALVKVLDGCAINGRYWVFAAAATDLEFDITVADTLTGASWVQHNNPGVPAAAAADTDAFATCAQP